MSPNRRELDKALQELREERPSAEVRSRALTAVLSPRPGLANHPGMVAASVLVVGLGLFMIPTRSSGLAWSEVLRRTNLSANVHVTYLNGWGEVTGEKWSSGLNWAYWSKDKQGRITHEIRSDQSNFYFYLRRSWSNAPNAYAYGTLTNKTPAMLKAEGKYASKIPTIDSLVSIQKAKPISQETAYVAGNSVQRYVLKIRGSKLQTVDADPQSGRILFIRFANGETDTFDYPDKIDARVFSYKSRLTRNEPVLDLRGKEDPKKAPIEMPPIVATNGGINFRGVQLASDGTLYVEWSGYLPHTQQLKRLKLYGITAGKRLWFGYNVDGVHPVQGPPSKRLIIYRVELPERIGDRVSVQIPTASSVVVFKDVRISKMNPLRE